MLKVKEELAKVLKNTAEELKNNGKNLNEKTVIRLRGCLVEYSFILNIIDRNPENIIGYIDEENHFIEVFNKKTGFYARTGVIENGLDTGRDAFMRDFPQLIDVGIMGHCIHGKSGLCIKSGVQCYQNGLSQQEPNMSVEDFRRIVEEIKGRTFQLALGGRGDVDQHEHFEEILKICVENDIVPNFTSSGLGFTDEIIEICKKYCGAVAISEYRQTHTKRALEMLIGAGIKTNLHYVLGNNSIDEAIERLKNHDFPEGLNAVIFLLHKPVGLGRESNVLKPNDPRVKEFYELVDNGRFPFKVGFDSCNTPAIINYTSKILTDSIDTCEAARHSCYIDSNMKMIPCSFDNQELKWAYDIKNDSIENAWNSSQFNDFRSHFKNSCSGCKDKHLCMGGCPIRRSIVLCDRPTKDLK